MRKPSTNKKPSASKETTHVRRKKLVALQTGCHRYQYLVMRRGSAPKPRPEDLGPTTSTGRVQQHS